MHNLHPLLDCHRREKAVVKKDLDKMIQDSEIADMEPGGRKMDDIFAGLWKVVTVSVSNWSV